MTKAALLVTAVAGTAALAACAGPPSPPMRAAQTGARQCFLARQVNGYTPVSDEVVDVQVGANRYFQLRLSGTCPQSAFSRRVALRTTGGGDWICQGLDAEIIVPFAGGPERCLINDVQAISKEVWLADRRR